MSDTEVQRVESSEADQEAPLLPSNARAKDNWQSMRDVAKECFQNALKDSEEGGVRVRRPSQGNSPSDRISFKEAKDVLSKRYKGKVKEANLDFLTNFGSKVSKDGTPIFDEVDFGEFLDIVWHLHQRDVNDFIDSMWRLQAKRHTVTACKALEDLEIAYTSKVKRTELTTTGGTELQSLKDRVRELEKVWEKVDRHFFSQALQSLSGRERLSFLDSLVFRIELKDTEDYLTPGLGTPGETLPSQKRLSNANNVKMVSFAGKGAKGSQRIITDEINFSGTDYKFPIENDDVRITYQDYNDVFAYIEDMVYGKGDLPWFAYTIVNISPQHLRLSPEILKTIASGDVCQTLLIRGVLSQAWDDVQLNYYLNMASQLVYAVSLLCAAGYSREHQLPPKCLVILVALFSLARFGQSLAELSAGLWAAMDCEKEKKTADYSYSYSKAFGKIFVLSLFIILFTFLIVCAVDTARTDSTTETHWIVSMLNLALVAGVFLLSVLFGLFTWFCRPRRRKRRSKYLFSQYVIILVIIWGSFALALYQIEPLIRVSSEQGRWSLIFFFCACVSAACMIFFVHNCFARPEIQAIKSHIFVGHFWTFFEFIMSVYGVALVAGFIYFNLHWREDMDLWHPIQGKLMYRHPTWLALFVCFKIQEVIQKCLCIRGIGENVIPAYNALCDQASTRVIMFLLLLWLNSFLTYYALPVVHTDDWLDNVWQMGITMFRLDMSGDFDLNYLEGLNPRLNMTTGEIEDSVEFKPWHKAIGIMYMMFFLFMNIGLLNVYIGIVSTVYSQKFKERHEMFEAYRAIYIYKILVFQRLYMYEEPEPADAVWLMYSPGAGARSSEQEHFGRSSSVFSLRSNSA